MTEHAPARGGVLALRSAAAAVTAASAHRGARARSRGMPLNLAVGAREQMGLRKRVSSAAADSPTAGASGAKPVSPLMHAANLFGGLTENQQMGLLAVCCAPFVVAILIKWRALGVI